MHKVIVDIFTSKCVLSLTNTILYEHCVINLRPFFLMFENFFRVKKAIQWEKPNEREKYHHHKCLRTVKKLNLSLVLFALQIRKLTYFGKTYFTIHLYVEQALSSDVP